MRTSAGRAKRARIVVLLLLALALIASVVSVTLPARAAAAVPPACDETGCDPNPTLYTFTSTLQVSPPASGVIRGSSGASAFACRPDGADCSVTDTIETTSPRRPVGGWPTYTLQASEGPAGFGYQWRTGCSGTGDCVVVNNKASAPEVAGDWVDTLAPEILTFTAPASVSATTPFRVVARDNDRVSAYQWRTCVANTDTCDRDYSGTADTYTVGPRAGGTLDVFVRVGDPAGHWSTWASARVKYDATAPTLAITSADAWSTRRIETTFTVSDASEVSTTCAVDDGTYAPCSSPYAVDVSDFGDHVVHVVATDVAGNVSRADRSVRAVAYALQPAVDTDPVYGRDWTVVYGSLPGDATGTVTVRDRASKATLCSGPAGRAHQGSCRVAGTALRPGGHTLDVSYAGDARNPAATGAVTVTVRPPSPPTTTIAATAPVTRYGAAHLLTASRLPASGLVTFTAGGRTLCRAAVRSGVARCSATGTSLVAGSHVAVATYTDPVYPQQRVLFRVVVARGATTMTARAGSATLHRRTTLTAALLPRTATGRVVFTNGKRVLCVAAVRAGKASCATSPNRSRARVTVRAAYSGDRNWLPVAVRTSYRVR